MTDLQRQQEQITAFWNERGPSYEDQAIHRVQGDAEERVWQGVLRGLLPLPPAHVVDVVSGDAIAPPLRHSPTLDPVVAPAKAAGFTDVRVVRLQAIEQFERENAPRDLIWLALTATRPGA